ncbi:hypothetical protein ACU42Y_13875 [Proteus mirabilis]
MAEIDDMLRFGAQDVFLKPVTNLAKLKQKVIEVLCPGFFESELIARDNLDLFGITYENSLIIFNPLLNRCTAS